MNRAADSKQIRFFMTWCALSPPRIAGRDMRAQPVFVQIETEPRPLGNRKRALADRRFRTLRHLLFISPEGAQRILYFEKVLCGGTQVHRRVKPDEGTWPAVHTHRSSRKGSVVGDF